MDEPPPPLLKSRIPRKSIIVDDSYQIDNLHCPLRKGIIYYCENGAILERNIYSSGKQEPRIIVPKHLSWHLTNFSFFRIEGNQILLFAKYVNLGQTNMDHCLHLSIHEIRSDSRVGPTLWSFDKRVELDIHYFDLELIKFTENPLAITLWVGSNEGWKLFDISTTETDASKIFTLIESGRIDLDVKIKGLKWVRENSLVKLSPDRHILLNADLDEERQNEMIDIHYSDSGGTNFSFVTRMSIPTPRVPEDSNFGLPEPKLVFSADGSKFAIATHPGRVSIWDIRSKVPLETFMVPQNDYPVHYLQFSSGKLGKEVLVFVARNRSSRLDTIHVIDVTLFETLLLEVEWLENSGRYPGVRSLFFDPSGETLYAENNGTLYEWNLQKNKHGSQWWIGEE